MRELANQTIERGYQGFNDRLDVTKPRQVEIIMPNGERRYFRAKSCSPRAIEFEAIAYIRSIEKAIHRPVCWRYAGERLYRMGNNPSQKYQLVSKIKKAILSFFDLDD